MLCMKLFLLLLAILAIHAYDSCRTPYNKLGRCVPLNQCRDYWNYPQKSSGAFRRFITESKCLMLDKVMYMCCETDQVIDQDFYNHPPTKKVPTTSVTPLTLGQIKNCGIGKIQKISNGENATVGEYKWMALLRYDFPEDPFRCAGSLITNFYMLTAAHCFTLSQPFSVRLGEHTLSTENDCIYQIGSNVPECYKPQDFGILHWRVHPEYAHANRQNDIALVKLDRNVVFDKLINPICLPIMKETQKLRFIRSFIVAGWGRTHNNATSDILQKVILQSRELSACTKLQSGINITNYQLCVGGTGFTDTCMGDSGGPLFYYMPYNRKRRFVQFGITSFGLSECGAKNNSPSVYTNIISYLPWIKKNIK